MNDPFLPPPELARPLRAAGWPPVIDAVTGGHQSRSGRLLGANGRTVRRWVAASPEVIEAIVRTADGEAPPGRLPERSDRRGV